MLRRPMVVLEMIGNTAMMVAQMTSAICVFLTRMMMSGAIDQPTLHEQESDRAADRGGEPERDQGNLQRAPERAHQPRDIGHDALGDQARRRKQIVRDRKNATRRFPDREYDEADDDRRQDFGEGRSATIMSHVADVSRFGGRFRGDLRAAQFIRIFRSLMNCVVYAFFQSTSLSSRPPSTMKS
jgi:hypothetical protein